MGCAAVAAAALCCGDGLGLVRLGLGWAQVMSSSSDPKECVGRG